VIKGAALQDFINKAVQYRPLERLDRPVAVVATDLHSGEMVVFRSGDSGMAVRASSAVPGVFQPVMIDNHEYVDGGLVSPIPINVARTLGADFIIAVDISKSPESNKIESYVEVMMQSYIIMGQTIRRYELPGADIVIRPDMLGIGGLNFKGREHAILAGEKAALAIMPELKLKLEKLRSAH
jgi:NTE family protein